MLLFVPVFVTSPNRSNLLDYQDALAAGLAIGSGEVEGAHRHVIRARPRIAGAWWKRERICKMPAPSVVRTNRDSEDYRGSVQEKARKLTRIFNCTCRAMDLNHFRAIELW